MIVFCGVVNDGLIRGPRDAMDLERQGEFVNLPDVNGSAIFCLSKRRCKQPARQNTVNNCWQSPLIWASNAPGNREAEATDSMKSL